MSTLSFYIKNMKNFEDIDNSLGIQPKWKKVKKANFTTLIPLSTGNRGGGIYPWTAPSFEVGDSFFKPMSLEDIRANRGRPSPSASARELGFVWKTKGAWSETEKLYGYACTRQPIPEVPNRLFS